MERNGTEWNGMEKVNKTRNGTAESAQSTPTHPWLTELHPRKLFVHTERGWRIGLPTHLAGNGWEADYTNSVLQCISCCFPQEVKTVLILTTKEPYQSLYTLEMLLLLWRLN